MPVVLTDDAKRRLERVIELIEEEPKRMNMNTWGDTQPELKCNTVGCIAGWVVFDEIYRANNNQIPEGGLYNESYWMGISYKARILLGLDYATSGRLFRVPNWPDEFRSDHSSCDHIYIADCWKLSGDPEIGTPEYVAVVVARIRHFIETGE